MRACVRVCVRACVRMCARVWTCVCARVCVLQNNYNLSTCTYLVATCQIVKISLLKFWRRSASQFFFKCPGTTNHTQARAYTPHTHARAYTHHTHVRTHTRAHAHTRTRAIITPGKCKRDNSVKLIGSVV